MVSAADVWVRGGFFYFDAKWKFSFETSRFLNCAVTEIALTKWGILITGDQQFSTFSPTTHQPPTPDDKEYTP